VEAHVRTKLRVLGSASAIGLIAETNITIDPRVRDDAHYDLASALSMCPDDASEIAIAISRCFEHHTLSGPLISTNVQFLGRAISFENFCDLLVKERAFATRAGAASAIRSLHLKSVHKIHRTLTDVPLGRYLMWSTFAPHDARHLAFDSFPDDADYVRGVLGLSRLDRGDPLVILDYSRPRGLGLRFPTVADCYAGSAWNYFFNPAPDGHEFGLTKPWPEYETEAPRPEVVHDVLTSQFLVRAPRVLA
jgi:hypothetical protein